MGSTRSSPPSGGGRPPKLASRTTFYLKVKVDHDFNPPLAPAARARTGSVAGPVAGLSRNLARGITGDLAASLAAGIALAGGVLKIIFRAMRLHKPLGQPYTQKNDFQ